MDTLIPILAPPATLVAIFALSYALQRLLGRKGLGFAVNATVLSAGMAAGVSFVALCQSLA